MARDMWDAFDAAWARGECPRIEDFLDSGSDAAHLLELVKIDIEYRWKSVHPTSGRQRSAAAETIGAGSIDETQWWIEDYLARFPCLSAASIEDLIAEEYRARLQWGPAFDRDEYRQRFPKLSLDRLLDEVETEVRDETSAWRTRASDAVLPEINGYAILEEIGRGGMGVVYRARQTSLNRDVAIKLVNESRGSLATWSMRLKTEAEAVARVQHPNIVQVFETGLSQGRPYLVMEYCVGVSLARKLALGPAPPLAAAKLVALLARAMHAAHQKAVIHRDLTPANVLLTAASPDQALRSPWEDVIPKIVDFGLAKQLEMPGATVTGFVLGTPSYMAPEQAAGQLVQSPVADVYSLGAILYELVAGRPPFRAATAMATLDQVRKDEPLPLRQLQPRCPKDLETICLSCLRKEPHKRYATAEALAADLDRFSSGQIILARPATAWERAAKWARRHPAWTTAAALMLIAGLATIVLVAVHTSRLNRQIAFAERERTRAQTHFRQAFAAVNQMLTRVGIDRLQNADGLEGTQREVLEDAVRFYSELLATSDEGIPELRLEQARGHRRLGTVQFRLGHLPEGTKSLLEARRLLAQLASEGETPQLQSEIIQTHFDLAEAFLAAASGDAARAEFVAVEQLCQPSADTDLESARNLVHANLGIAKSTRRNGEIGQRLEASLRIVKQIQDRGGSSAKDQLLLGMIHHNLGAWREQSNDLPSAESHFVAARKCFEPLCEKTPEADSHHGSLAETYGWLAMIYAKTGRAGLADELYQKALGVYQTLSQRFPSARRYRQETARMMLNYGVMLNAIERYPEAAKQFQSSAELREQLALDGRAVEIERKQLAETYQNLAIVRQKLQRPKEAEAAYDRGCQIMEQLCEKNPKQYEMGVALSGLYLNRAVFRQVSGDLDAAMDLLNRAITILSNCRQHLPDDPNLRTYLYSAFGARSQICEAKGQFDRAAESWTQLLELVPSDQQTDYRLSRAMCWMRSGAQERAVGEIDAISKLPGLSGLNCYNVACIYGVGAHHAAAGGRPDQAGPFIEKGLALIKRAAELGLFRENPHLRDHAATDPDLASLRSSTRFAELITSRASE